MTRKVHYPPQGGCDALILEDGVPIGSYWGVRIQHLISLPKDMKCAHCGDKIIYRGIYNDTAVLPGRDLYTCHNWRCRALYTLKIVENGNKK